MQCFEQTNEQEDTNCDEKRGNLGKFHKTIGDEIFILFSKSQIKEKY